MCSWQPGGCRQEQQKEMQEHKDKEEMQDEMASQEAGLEVLN